MKSQNPAAPNFLDRSDHRFVELHHVCHTLFRQQLHRDGIGSATKETSIITKEEENKLWPSGILGLHHPKALLRTLILLYRQSICLIGREENRARKVSQFEQNVHSDKYIYTEHGSKNRNGGLSHSKLKTKVVPVFTNPEAGGHCLVRILDFYFEKLPNRVKKNIYFTCNLFLKYLLIPVHAPWFKNQVVGKILLALLGRICLQGRGY